MQAESLRGVQPVCHSGNEAVYVADPANLRRSVRQRSLAVRLGHLEAQFRRLGSVATAREKGGPENAMAEPLTLKLCQQRGVLRSVRGGVSGGGIV